MLNESMLIYLCEVVFPIIQLTPRRISCNIICQISLISNSVLDQKQFKWQSLTPTHWCTVLIRHTFQPWRLWHVFFGR